MVNKEEKTKKPILRWILTIWFGLSIFVFFPSVASILYALVAFAVCPVTKIREIWDKIIPRNTLRTVLVIVVAFVALMISPPDETLTEPVDNNIVPIETESISKEVAESIEDTAEQEIVEDLTEGVVFETTETVEMAKDVQGESISKSDEADITVMGEKIADVDAPEILVTAGQMQEQTPEPEVTLTSEPTPEPAATPTPEPIETPEVALENNDDGSGGNGNNDGGTGNPNIGQLEENEIEAPAGTTYVLNKNTKKFHYESCKSAKKIKDKNRAYHTGTREECISMGYDPCGNCNP